MSKEKPVALGNILDIEIEGVSHQGWGIGRYDGFTVFVPGSLPGEIVNMKIKQVKKTYAVGELIRVANESSYRTEPTCSVYDSCGGCHIQHAEYEHQLHIKEKILSDALTKIGRLKNVQIHPVLGMTDPWKYRNRIQLHVVVTEDKIKIGFFKPGTHELVSFEECYLIPDVFSQMRSFLEEELNKNINKVDLSLLKHIVLKTSSYTREIAVVFVTSIKDFPLLRDLAGVLVENFPSVVSVVQNIQEKTSGALFGPEWQLILGKERLEEKIGDAVFSISPGSFVQVNSKQTQVLYSKVLEYADLKGQETVVDLYCGIGTISLLLAKKAGKVIGVEEFRAAVDDAEYNARINNFNNVEFIAGKAEVILPEMHASGINPDIIVLDPPRKGCDPVALEAIVRMKPRKLVYVSCDPATLARDLKILSEKGYKTIEVQPVDMFPQTTHVECVIMMTNSGSKGK
ncbi:MAG: 23S rRNA (uracil(1939)-C(5))-methyltransferase RlmD [Dehalobacterium sp.]